MGGKGGQVQGEVEVMLNHTVEMRISLNHPESIWPHEFWLPKQCM